MNINVISLFANATFDHYFGGGRWVPLAAIALIIGAFVVQFIRNLKKFPPNGGKSANGVQQSLFSDLRLEEAKRRVLEIFTFLEKQKNKFPAAGELGLGYSSRLHPEYQDFLALTHELPCDDEDDEPVRIGGKHVCGSKIRPNWICIGNDSMGYEIILQPNQPEVNTVWLKDGKEMLGERHANLYHLLLNELEYLVYDGPDFPLLEKILYRDLKVDE
ncbi:MAG: hypothetical protein ABI579_03780 [Candidatus Sumerlaeota bacterium]